MTLRDGISFISDTRLLEKPNFGKIFLHQERLIAVLIVPTGPLIRPNGHFLPHGEGKIHVALKTLATLGEWGPAALVGESDNIGCSVH